MGEESNGMILAVETKDPVGLQVLICSLIQLKMELELSNILIIKGRLMK
ncbi:MAG: hypothetical protein MZV64_39290 [Ignavibacteriales bacterium]|nr:hypothetical protein [Ignavibacteriales bacterium]